MADDALALVLARNQFYRRQYLICLLGFFLSLILIGFLSFILYYLVKNPTKPIYFATDKVSQLIDIIPTSQPNMPLDAVTAWTLKAVKAAYSFDVLNYRSQFQYAQQFFTKYGWNNYMSALAATNNLLAVTTQKMIVQAEAADKPQLVVQGLLGGAYAYKYRIPMLISYMTPPYDNSPNARFVNAVIVNVIVQRQPILQSKDGLGIVQIIATSAAASTSTTSPTANSNNP